MLDWKSHHQIMHRLYLIERKTTKEIVEHMKSNYSFHATEAQYESQFRKWKFQKNLKKEDWVYIFQKMRQRGQRETVVYHNDVLVPPNKVKKHTSRCVHPNDAYRPSVRIPSPEYVVVRSPSPNPDFHAISTYRPTRTRRCSEISEQGPSRPNKRRLMSVNGATLQTIPSTALSEHSSWTNAFHVLKDVDLSDLPYFQLRDLFDSPDAKRLFQEILTLDDPVSGEILYHFWPETSSPVPAQMLSDSPYGAIDMEMGDDWKAVFQRLRPEPKPFGITFLQPGSLDYDDLIHQRCAMTNLTSFLAKIPRKNDKEAQVLEELLRGPPTIDAARRFVEVGIYNVSNLLFNDDAMDLFIETLLQNIPWTVLHPLLSLPATSVQAFTESVFLHAIDTERLQVVEDLLQHDWIRATVVSNGSALRSAIGTSSCKLVSLMLSAGPDPNGNYYFTPLHHARNIPVARLLLEAGAGINGGRKGMSALLKATARKNISLVRYLIEEGADVAWDNCKYTSATMLAVQNGTIDILQLLLASGALPNKAFTDEGTPLQKAAELGDIPAVLLLLQYQANVNAPALGKSGKTALHAAVSRANIEMTKLLLEKRADVHVLIRGDTDFPHSLLTIAVEMNNLDLVKVILDAGADINIPSFGYYGCTALESTMHVPNGSTVRDLLITRGALYTAQSNNEHRQIQLRMAVWAADLARVKALLETGFKIDMQPFEDSPNDRPRVYAQGQSRRSILQDAIVVGTDMFQLLFGAVQKYDEDIDFHRILVEAIKAKNLEILITLLAAGADVNSTHGHAGRMIGTPLMFAVRENDLETVRYLYDNGANINIAVQGFFLGPYQCASTALQTSLWVVELSGHRHRGYDIFHFLRQHGATVNAPVPRLGGLSELARASRFGMLTTVQELLNSGAEVNSLPAEIDGRTALQAAASAYHAIDDIVQLLLQGGANVNAPTACRGGITALGAAAERGHFQIALMLLKAGADVNAEFEPYLRVKRTALNHAALRGRLDMVHLLLKAGADLHLPKDKRYIQAIKYAEDKGHIAVATAIKEFKVGEELAALPRASIPETREERTVIELD